MSVCLIACGSAKRPGIHAAKDLYIGGIFAAARAYAETFDEWAILSAGHGLLLPDEEIAAYEAHMPRRAPERRAWAHRVAAQVDARWPEPASFTITAGRPYREAIAHRRYYCPWEAETPPLRPGGWQFGHQVHWLQTHALRRQAVSA